MFKFLRKTYLYILAVPLLFLLLGAASNQLVLITNHDTFPVLVNKEKAQEFLQRREIGAVETGDAIMLDATHCIMTDTTHFNLLADVIDRGDGFYSIGDLLLELGGWLWAFAPYVWMFAAVQKLRKLQD